LLRFYGKDGIAANWPVQFMRGGRHIFDFFKPTTLSAVQIFISIIEDWPSNFPVEPLFQHILPATEVYSLEHCFRPL
jgi:hypothetical protein